MKTVLVAIKYCADNVKYIAKKIKINTRMIEMIVKIFDPIFSGIEKLPVKKYK